IRVRPESPVARARVFGRPGARPFIGIDLRTWREHQDHDAPVGLIGGVAPFVLFFGLELLVFRSGEHQDGIELAATLIVALAFGIAAAGQEVRLLETKRLAGFVHADRIHVLGHHGGAGLRPWIAVNGQALSLLKAAYGSAGLIAQDAVDGSRIVTERSKHYL